MSVPHPHARKQRVFINKFLCLYTQALKSPSSKVVVVLFPLFIWTTMEKSFHHLTTPRNLVNIGQFFPPHFGGIQIQSREHLSSFFGAGPRTHSPKDIYASFPVNLPAIFAKVKSDVLWYLWCLVTVLSVTHQEKRQRWSIGIYVQACLKDFCLRETANDRCVCHKMSFYTIFCFCWTAIINGTALLFGLLMNVRLE